MPQTYDLGTQWTPTEIFSLLLALSLMDFHTHTPAVRSFPDGFKFLSSSKTATFSSNKKLLNYPRLFKKSPRFKNLALGLVFEKNLSSARFVCPVSGLPICCSHSDFTSALVCVLALLLPGLLSCSLIPQSPKGLLHEITRDINTVLQCKHSDDL